MLPIFKDDSTNLMLMQNKWAAELNPVLNNPTTNLSLLKNVALASGVTVVNHKLGKTQQGWVVLDVNGAATIYRSQPFNDKTLTLTSSAAVVVTLGVF